MRLSFDLDGVLASTNIPIFRLADQLKGKIAIEIYNWNFRTAKLLLNPMDFLVYPDDEFYIITSRIKESEKITKEWVKKYCPNCKKLIILNNGTPKENAGEKEIYEWLDEMAESKAEVINEYNIEVYFEDSSYIVKKLRKLCPKCKVINYGGRI